MNLVAPRLDNDDITLRANKEFAFPMPTGDELRLMGLFSGSVKENETSPPGRFHGAVFQGG